MEPLRPAYNIFPSLVVAYLTFSYVYLPKVLYSHKNISLELYANISIFSIYMGEKNQSEG